MLTADASRDTPPAEAPHCIRGTAAKKLHQYLARRITTEDDERARTSGLHQPREGDRERADIGDAVQSCEIREGAIEGRQATRMRALSEGAQRLQHGLLYGYVAVAGRAKLGCGELDHARCPVGHHQLVTALEEEACVVPGSAAQLEQPAPGREDLRQAPAHGPPLRRAAPPLAETLVEATCCLVERADSGGQRGRR